LNSPKINFSVDKEKFKLYYRFMTKQGAENPIPAEVTGVEATLHDLTSQGATVGELAIARAILEPIDPEAAKRVRRVQEDLIDSSRLSGAARSEKVRTSLLPEVSTIEGTASDLLSHVRHSKLQKAGRNYPDNR
jgi:hypothetical protein